MAAKQEHKTKINDRVRIRDNATTLYPMARAYMEGTVRSVRHDHLGYPLVFVEWDRNHWAYSGEPDRWALEAHFDIVEERPVAEDSDKLIADLMKVLEAHRSQDASEAREEPSLRNERTEGPTYDQALVAAIDDATDAEAFIMIVARKEEFQGAEIIVPHMYSGHKREDALLLLESVMSDAGAQHHMRLVYQTINQQRQESDGEEGA